MRRRTDGKCPSCGRKLGDKESAKRYFEEALKICEMDKIWDRESMNEIISIIKAEIASVT